MIGGMHAEIERARETLHNITTEDFRRGGDRTARDALDMVRADLRAVWYDLDGLRSRSAERGHPDPADVRDTVSRVLDRIGDGPGADW